MLPWLIHWCKILFCGIHVCVCIDAAVLSVVQIFAREKYEPLQIDSAEDYQKFVRGYSLQDPTVKVDFPCRMPFSVSCPLICRATRNLIHDYVQFADFLPDMEVSIRRAVDAALTREVNAMFIRVLDDAGTSGSLHISQPAQLSANAEHLTAACDFFESYVTSFGDPRYLKPFRLQARDVFQATRTRCFDIIMELIDNKIDMLMSATQQMDWTPDDKIEDANDYVMDVVSYLNSTFMCLEHMPEGFRQAIHFTACKHIADVYLNTIMGVKKFNIVALFNVNHDVC